MSKGKAKRERNLNQVSNSRKKRRDRFAGQWVRENRPDIWELCCAEAAKDYPYVKDHANAKRAITLPKSLAKRETKDATAAVATS